MSLAIIAAVGAVVVGATGAWFSDTETSTGNTFTAGAIDVKIDSECHYNDMDCINGFWNDEDFLGNECACNWLEKDLDGDIFFNFGDIKPGDNGENTISLHVEGNDAWGRMLISNVKDLDNTCTEPEIEAESECQNELNNGTDDGELRENLMLYAWLDQGVTPGFQGKAIYEGEELVSGDEGEGDNIQQCDPEYPENCAEPLVITKGTIDEDGEEHIFSEGLSLVYVAYCSGFNSNGHNDHGFCHGIAGDGRLVGSTVYYMGVAWDVDGATTGNEAQTDSLEADISFEAVQHRNNPDGNFNL